MKYDFVNQNVEVKENQEEAVEIATPAQDTQSSSEIAPEENETFDFVAFIQEERNQALKEESDRHQETKDEINLLFDEMERLEKERPNALKVARKRASETLESIKTLIEQRSNDVELEVQQVATDLREKTSAIVEEL